MAVGVSNKRLMIYYQKIRPTEQPDSTAFDRTNFLWILKNRLIYGAGRDNNSVGTISHCTFDYATKKQRCTCKNCRIHWIVQSHFVRPKHSIVAQVQFKLIV